MEQISDNFLILHSKPCRPSPSGERDSDSMNGSVIRCDEVDKVLPYLCCLVVYESVCLSDSGRHSFWKWMKLPFRPGGVSSDNDDLPFPVFIQQPTMHLLYALSLVYLWIVIWNESAPEILFNDFHPFIQCYGNCSTKKVNGPICSFAVSLRLE